jgi:uncharacterized protein
MTKSIFRALVTMQIITISVIPEICLAKAPTAKTLLWEITGNGLSQPSYLLGTQHIGCSKQLTLSVEQENALVRTQQIYTERGYTYQPENRTVGKIIDPTKVPPSSKNKTLKNLITAQEYQIIEDYAGKEGLENLLRYDASWVVDDIKNDRSQELAVRFFNRRCKDIIAKEEIIVLAARSRKINTVRGLETNAEVEKTYRDLHIPLQTKVNGLIAMIKMSLSDFSLKISRPVKYYLDQDIIKLSEAPATDPDIQAGLVRNRRWIPRIESAMKQKPTFFAFGAAHLGGDSGVISLLEAKGYKLRPIFDQPLGKYPLAAKPQFSSQVLTGEDYEKIGRQKENEEEILEAIDNYGKVTDLWPRDVNPYIRRANLMSEKLLDFQGALAEINRAVTIIMAGLDDGISYGKAASVYYERAMLKLKYLQDFQGALTDFNKSLELYPAKGKGAAVFYEMFYLSRGLTKAKLKDFQGALLDFDTHLARYPQSVEGYIERGLLKYTYLADKIGGVNDMRRANQLARIQDNQVAIDKTQAVLLTMGEKL